MCGIAGIFSYRDGQPVDRSLLERMTDRLAHRGPDGFGFHYSHDGSLGLGHRRLSIIDLVTGDQPMTNEEGSVWIVFNGEIYNFKDLRDPLRQRGHQFKTASDTEVLIHGYEEWGTAIVDRLNGIFAFAIWDEKRKSLFLARDHFGVKPLYYHDTGEKIYFASEIKSLLVNPGVSKAIDIQALHQCIAFRHTPAPRTLFSSIRKLPPASMLEVGRDGIRFRSFMPLPPVIDRSKSFMQWGRELETIYPEAVKRQMVSDVPIGLSLSGGVDSNTLLALMSRANKNVHTFTVGFEGSADRDNEIENAEAAAEKFVAEFHSEMISEDAYIDFMESYIWHLEEPVGNESAAAYYFVAKLARSRVKVLLSGQGADEPFAGYDRHLAARYAPYLLWMPKKGIEWLGRKYVSMQRGSESPGRIIDALLKSNELDQFLSIYSITTPVMRRTLFNEDHYIKNEEELLRDYMSSQLGRAPEGTLLERMTYVDARTSLSDNLLLCGDKMAMATSVEMRVPFLDRELMAVAERIPGRYKVARFKNKLIHKHACRKWLHEEVVTRRKIGFNEAMGKWMQQNLHGHLADLIAAPDSVTRTIFNRDIVLKLMNEHKAGEADHQRFLFLLLSIETWNKVFRTT